jgi:hypothetical protein
MTRLLSFVAAALLACHAAGLSRGASAQPVDGAGEIAIIGSSVITEDMVDRIAEGRPNAHADLPPEERRDRIRDMLLAEYLIDYYYGRETGRLTQPVLDGLDDARRQVLFQFFAQSQFRPPAITDADVARFAAGNPGLFEERRSYRHVEITIAGGSEAAREAARARVAAALEDGATVAALDTLLGEMQGEGLSLGMATAWVPSEVLPDDRRARLLEMAETGRRVDVMREAGRVSVIGLYEAVPIPADPARLRGRIEQRLVAEAFAAHREALVAELAQTALGRSAPAQAPAAPAASGASKAVREVGVPPRGSVVWSAQPAVPRNIRLAALFSVALFGALSGLALVHWLRLVLRQGPLERRLRLVVPALRRPGVAVALSVAGLAALLGSLALALPVAVRTLGDTTTLVIASGGVVIALAAAWAWRARARRSLAQALEARLEEHEDETLAHDLTVVNLSSGRDLALALALAVVYGVAMALLLDVPTGLS